eukprot:TRINITY_DN2055_c0_g3_i1.p1 TRINITY_DN2055_c0_g3~~TRINITY_DN2055_c0_g3_i1.p1  ORF type:complete len:779 (+),score=241.13 TRINITY_DN2055_c0_g3_i1:93-2339(+)
MSSVSGISPSFGVNQSTKNKKQRFQTYAVKRTVFSAQPASFYSINNKKLSRGFRHLVKTAETDEEPIVQQELAQKPVQMERKVEEIQEEQEEEVQQQQYEEPQPQEQSTYRTSESNREVFLPFDSIVIGEIYPGKVERLANFGAFVNIGSEVDGLVHISQLAYEFVSDPGDFVQVGQEVKVKVLDKNNDDMRLQLSMKINGPGEGGRPRGGRGQAVADKVPLEDIQEGEVYTGQVKRTAGFGAFVDIGTVSDGLVHVSQLSNSYVEDVQDVVQVGDEVQVKVLSVDLDNQKIELSMKAVRGGEEEEDMEYEGADEGDEFAREKRQMRRQSMESGGRGGRRQQTPPPDVSEGDQITGPIKRIAAYGVFVDIGNNFQAMLHKNEMKVDSSADPLWQVRDFFQVDQEITVTIQKVEENKVELTQKSKADKEEEIASKAGFTAMDEENSYKPSLFANAFQQAGIARTKYPDIPERAIVDPPEDILPDVVEEAIEEAVEEVTAGIDEVEEKIEEAEEQVPTVEDVVEEVAEKVPEITEQVPAVEDVVEEVVEKVAEITEQVPVVAEEVVEKVEEIAEQTPVVQNVVEEVAEKVEEISEQVPAVAEEVAEKVEEVAEQVPVVQNVVEEVAEKVEEIIEQVPETSIATEEKPEQIVEENKVVDQISEQTIQQEQKIEETEQIPEQQEPVAQESESTSSTTENAVESPQLEEKDAEDVQNVEESATSAPEGGSLSEQPVVQTDVSKSEETETKSEA